MKVLIFSRLSAMPTYKQDDFLISSLIEKGVQVWVVTNSALHVKKYTAQGARATLHYPDSKFSIKSIRLLRSILKEQQTDVLYLMDSRAVATGAMAATGLPVKVIAYRGAAGIYWHDPTTYLTHFHPRIDVVCCLSGYVKQEMSKNDLFKNRQYKVVHKGISEAWFGQKQQIKPADFNIPPADITIACVANLRKVKGVHYLLQAISKIEQRSNTRTLIIGDKTDTAEFRQEIAKSGVTAKVFGLGFQENVYSWIDTCDIYVQPSLSEGLGKSIMEAMMLGKAIIVTRSGGPEELIEDGKSGIIVPPKDPEAIARAINYLIENPEIRMEMGRNAKKRIATSFSLEHYADQMYELFTSTAQSREQSLHKKHLE